VPPHPPDILIKITSKKGKDSLYQISFIMESAKREKLIPKKMALVKLEKLRFIISQKM
jgi:hypothetical protein